MTYYLPRCLQYLDLVNLIINKDKRGLTMPLKFKKITEFELTDKAFEIVKTKIDKGEYNNYEELVDDLAKLLNVFPKKDRVKVISIIGFFVVLGLFIINFFG